MWYVQVQVHNFVASANIYIQIEMQLKPEEFGMPTLLLLVYTDSIIKSNRVDHAL